LEKNWEANRRKKHKNLAALELPTWSKGLENWEQLSFKNEGKEGRINQGGVGVARRGSEEAGRKDECYEKNQDNQWLLGEKTP